jgi:hypothetical protein
MPFIPRQVKPPARIAVTCKLPQHVATLLKCYAEFLDSSQEYVVTETLQLTFRKDREFHSWLAATSPDTAKALDGSSPVRNPSTPVSMAARAHGRHAKAMDSPTRAAAFPTASLLNVGPED